MSYTGAPVLITTTATGFDDEELNDTNIDGVDVSVYDFTGAVVLAATPMTWNPTKRRWEYKWDTTGLPPGRYRAELSLTGLDNLPTPDYVLIFLRRRPVPAGA